MFSVPQLIYSGKLDFLVFDYLSEITMSLLTAAKSKMPVSLYTFNDVTFVQLLFIKKQIKVYKNQMENMKIRRERTRTDERNVQEETEKGSESLFLKMSVSQNNMWVS